ncbi:S-adenosyl-L-methionine-dependent methyltransferase [Schizophyllum fasciatum]
MSALTTATNDTAPSANRNGGSTDAPRDGWSASLYGTAAPFVYSDKFTTPVMNLLAPQPGEHILDLGCGTGELTAVLARAVGSSAAATATSLGYVLGLDGSSNMVDRAREVVNAARAASTESAIAPVDLLVADAQTFQLPPSSGDASVGAWAGAFDAVFSNATLHWCSKDPLGALQAAARALRPGGRFVAEMGGMGNCIGVRAALHAALRRRGRDPVAVDPWFFPSVEEYSALLIHAGFTIREINLVPRVTPLPEGLAGCCECSREAVVREVEEAMAVDCRDREGRWSMMYVRLRFLAVLE